jgi:hypothetical protein
MTEKVKMSFKNDQALTNSLWQCEECLNQDTESYLLWCPGYLNLRETLTSTRMKNSDPISKQSSPLDAKMTSE